MPEGDTILRAARALHIAVAGRLVTAFESALPRLSSASIEGRTIERVHAAGKHLLMQFSGDLVLRTHMGMHGSWHIYRPGERWRRRRSDMRILITTREIDAVAFSVHDAEFRRGRAPIEAVARLGPDLLAERFDAQEALARLRRRPSDEIADALLNQQLIAGAGNIYKSEALFAARTNPFSRVSALADEDLLRILAITRGLLQRNVDQSGPWMRRTTSALNPGGRFAVYGRRGKACRRCGARIEGKRQGPHGRLTYWCPRCQR